MLIKYFTKKIIRFKNSSKILKLLYYYHYLFHDKKLGNIGFDFTSKKTRFEIIQNIIEKKKIIKSI